MKRLLEKHGTLVEELERRDRTDLISSIAGLLTSPQWHASTPSIEILQHLAVVTARGRHVLTPAELPSWLTQLGDGPVDSIENPVDNLFVSRVVSPHRNYLIFAGTHDAPGYYLERFLDVLEGMPAAEPFAALRRAAYALLALSNAVATRAGFTAPCTSESTPEGCAKTLRPGELAELRRRVLFTETDLEDLGITPSDLGDFLFDPTQSPALLAADHDDSALERRPVIALDGGFCLALPAAVSMAIRRRVIEFSAGEHERSLYAAYTCAIETSLAAMPILGGPSQLPIPFRDADGIFTVDLCLWADAGRLLHLCVVVDDFRGYAETGTAVAESNSSRFGALIEQGLAGARQAFADRPDLKDGVSLVVVCPWGRPVVARFDASKDERWRVAVIGVADLETLSFNPKFVPLDIWRMLDAKDRLARMNVEVLDPGGLLSLYAWLDSTATLQHWDGVPGDWEPTDTRAPLQILIPLTDLLRIRKETLDVWNPHRATTWDGRDLKVQRLHASPVRSSSDAPSLYISMDEFGVGNFLCVFETELRGWWTTVETPACTDRDARYRLSFMTRVWLSKAADVLERALSLPPGPVAWICRFEDSDDHGSEVAAVDRETARSLLVTEVVQNVIHVTARKGFLASLRNPTNVTDSVLIESLVAGAVRLSGAPADDGRLANIVAQIVPDECARVIHHINAQGWRHVVKPVKVSDPILITGIDHEYARLGLGWQGRKRSEGDAFEGEQACCAYVNRLIDVLWLEIRSRLRPQRREPLLAQLVENYESLMLEREHWLVPARATISLSRETGANLALTTDRLAEVDAALLGTRLLIEMALCECPESSGGTAGKLEIARLLAMVVHLHELGGVSEAIRSGSREARIRIGLLGRIELDSEFDDWTLTQYGAALRWRHVQQAAERYDGYFRAFERAKTLETVFHPHFWQAWNDAFGFTLDQLRTFTGDVNREGVRLRAFSFTVDFEALCRFQNRLSPDIVRRIVDAFTSLPRETWPTTPPGFAPRDWYPWRFRRRLSLVRRPILQIDTSANPRYLIAPGIVEDGVGRVVIYCLNGGYDARDFPAGRMRTWIGTAEHRRGQEFTAEVAENLQRLGWTTRVNVPLTAILNAKLPRNFGDVDVLAWRGERVLAMECKKLELAITMGEVGRQLYEFRGEMKGGKPDRLKKHLLRTELLQGRAEAVARFTRAGQAVLIEPWIVFSDIVPMRFAKIGDRHRIRIATLDQLDALLG